MWTGVGEGGQHTNLATVLAQILNYFLHFLVLTWTLDISSICEKLCRPPTVRDLKLKEIYHDIQYYNAIFKLASNFSKNSNSVNVRTSCQCVYCVWDPLLFYILSVIGGTCRSVENPPVYEKP